jgi:glycosyltransferase involved in cell wall biosynthesis
VPVIGSRCGGVPEMVIDGETGILVDEGDAQAIASGIDKYAGDVDFRKKVITNAVKKYDHDFSQKSIINRTMNGYFYRASRKE